MLVRQIIGLDGYTPPAKQEEAEPEKETKAAPKEEKKAEPKAAPKEEKFRLQNRLTLHSHTPMVHMQLNAL